MANPFENPMEMEPGTGSVESEQDRAAVEAGPERDRETREKEEMREVCSQFRDALAQEREAVLNGSASVEK